MPDGGIGEAALISALIGGGAAVTGAAVSSHAAGKAADAQAKSAADALAFQKDQYATSQRNLAPYMSLSQVALPQLSSLAGTHTQNYGLPGNVPAPRASLASVGAPGAGYGAAATPDGMIRMQAPDGSMKLVQRELVQRYLGLGARVV